MVLSVNRCRRVASLSVELRLAPRGRQAILQGPQHRRREATMTEAAGEVIASKAEVLPGSSVVTR